MLTVFFRTILIYLILILCLRISGKRQIGELQVSELVVTFMLSELAVFPITDKNIPLLYAVVPIISLLSLEVIFSFLQTKSISIRKLLSGRPVILISKGKLSVNELKKNRIDLEEFLGELRQKDVFDIGDVEYAVLEENGKLSVLKKAYVSALTPEQLELNISDNGMCHCVIVDSCINQKALFSAGITEKTLDQILRNHNKHICEVFLMTINDSGGVTLYSKNECDSGNMMKAFSFNIKKDGECK